jgi:hypothetical protein
MALDADAPQASAEPRAARPYMPGYEEMFNEGMLPWSWARRILDDARNYWFASNRPGGPPHVMPVWGIWLDDTFCFSTAVTSKKARNIAADPRCTVTAETADGQVILEGIAAIDSMRIRAFLDRYSAKYNWPMAEEPFFAVTPSVVFGFPDTAVNSQEGATRWLFE